MEQEFHGAERNPVPLFLFPFGVFPPLSVLRAGMLHSSLKFPGDASRWCPNNPEPMSAVRVEPKLKPKCQ